MSHSSQYERERESRWAMASRDEWPAARHVGDALSRILGISCMCGRLDERVFAEFDPGRFDWARGCPDFALKLGESFLLLEIKLKAVEFRKTEKGGVTASGSAIENYGCPSYYIDIVPVLRNMNLFCRETGAGGRSFAIAFVPAGGFGGTRIVSLAKVNAMADKGWRSPSGIIPLCRFGEGYGQDTLLIPKDSATPLESLAGRDILSMACAPDRGGLLNHFLKKVFE